MSDSYTSQRWKAERDHGWILTQSRSGLGYSIVATVAGASQGFTPAEFEHNAKLIAAAPDMLELLHEICTELKYRGKTPNLKKYREQAEELFAWVMLDEDQEVQP